MIKEINKLDRKRTRQQMINANMRLIQQAKMFNISITYANVLIER